jgi:hypothetical protein
MLAHSVHTVACDYFVSALQTLPASAPPPYSCRSGLSVLLNELGSQGRSNAVPFRMAMKRQQHGDETLHVSCLEKRSLSQVR